ncbi:ABC transporter ATP-binding protein [Neorhizobium lilium]|uniref:ABC transporter ATP-binding protein n=1 Tax=Neorhizobium lilium TaxID=2503024 RepID=A0A444LNF1_9HYPH|nr:ABC transporter ATP-binding protein [Neorhizobium lilium]RWX81866.1 ABC transporter ATP-binding protein [Neorhizobium lilium]
MLSLRSLAKTYPNGVEALGALNLDILAGEIVAVIGGSGCGKSTLLRLISGLESATRGQVKIHGEQVMAPHPLINLIFQEPRLLPWLTVEQNICFGIRHLDRLEQGRRLRAVLQQVQLQSYEKRLPKELSGGQAQRVAIARALITQPEVLLLDEPFSALDAMTRASLQDHLLEIWRDAGPTIVIVTHDIEEAAALAHRVVVMQPSPGRILEEIDMDLPLPRHELDLEPYKKRIRAALRRSLASTDQPELNLNEAISNRRVFS